MQIGIREVNPGFILATNRSGLDSRQNNFMLSVDCPIDGEMRNWLDRTACNWAEHHGTVLNIAVALGPPRPSLEQSLGCTKHGEVMKILYILRLLSGNLAKPRLLL